MRLESTISWLLEQAEKEGCEQLHLDSGVQREEAHRFYEHAGMAKTSFHFSVKVAPGSNLADMERFSIGEEAEG